MTYLRVGWFAFRNNLREQARYPFQTGLGLLVFVAFGVLLGLGSVALLESGDVGTNAAAFFTAFLAGGAFRLPGDIVGSGRQQLQEIYLRPLPSLAYIVAVALGRGLEFVLTLGTLTLAVVLATGSDPSVVLRLVMVAVPLFVAMLGLGLALAGVQLVVQKVGQLSNLAMLLFIGTGLAAPPALLAATSTWSPFAAALWHVRGGELLVVPLASTAVVFLGMGAIAFRLGERAMLARGVMTLE